MASEPVRVLRNTFFVSVGFGVLAVQKLQVHRREVEKAVKPSIDAVVHLLHPNQPPDRA
jgi:hypothetical protein